jgi:alpha-galactosidase
MRIRYLLLFLGLMVPGLGADERPIWTPKAGPEPRINGPVVYGARAGRPFLYRIPATGVRPMTFGATALPGSLALDAETGIVSGHVPEKDGEYLVMLSAENALGSTQRPFKIVVGETLALTPPMGWNHWYTHYDHITDELMREAADVMVSSGMADYGYQYVNIDDCWMRLLDSDDPEVGGAPRAADGTVLPNKRFPDMKGLADYIHSKGLRAGLYTSPGPWTCQKFEGSWQHEEIDAKTYAAWGYDFLKYDWCGYSKIKPEPTLAERKEPYSKMGSLLASLDRDIVLNLCQYGKGDVWKWGGEVGGQCWRTTGDLGLHRGDSKLPGFYHIGMANAKHFEYAKPGQWNDPDYILIGHVGNARKKDEPAKLTSLTAYEQYSYMSMWSLMASPLFFSGEMGSLDEFTLNVLCNAEVIEVNQDPLGRQARIVRETAEEFVLAKPMVDGSLAVGLFNLSDGEREISVSWEELGIEGERAVRDVWRQRELGGEESGYSAVVQRHGVMMVRVRK